MTTHFDNKDDYLVRRAWELLDPLQDMDVPPMTVTAAELRRRAEQRHHGPARQWWWHQRALLTRRKLTTLITATVALAVGVGAAVFTFALAAPPAVAAPAPLSMDTGDVPSARAWLLSTIAGLATLDGSTQRPNTYVHLQRWAIDTTSPELELYAFDERLWWQPDTAAVTAISKLPAQPAGKVTAQWLVGAPSGTSAEVVHHPAGSYSLLIDRPSADLATFKSQLETQEPASNGPQATLRSVAAFAQFHYFDVRQRVTALRSLAEVEGIRWRGRTTDRAGRPGFALSVDSTSAGAGSVRDVLVVGPRGEFLSHELITLTPPAGFSVPRYTVTAYTLFLECERTFDFGP